MMQEMSADRHISGSIVFISDMDGDPWGGSEELWWESCWKLMERGARVRASVIHWSPLHAKVQALIDAGVDVQARSQKPSLMARLSRKITGREDHLHYFGLERWLRRDPPALVVINTKFAFPSPELPELLSRNGWPYIIVSHANADFWWPTDELASLATKAIENSVKTYFVSEGNRKLARKQAAFPMEKTGIVRNPYGVSRDEPCKWPEIDPGESLQIACVGRLDPRSKGQDILIEALASAAWAGRNWNLNLYGSGSCKETIVRIARELGVGERVILKGHTPVAEIYAENHVLALTSRAEGLPITIVEAMYSGRPILTTDVAGNAELLEEGVTGFIAEAPAVKCVSDALERLWDRRNDLRGMGGAAHQAARRQLPADPAGEFAEALIGFAMMDHSGGDMPERSEINS